MALDIIILSLVTGVYLLLAYMLFAQYQEQKQRQSTKDKELEALIQALSQNQEQAIARQSLQTLQTLQKSLFEQMADMRGQMQQSLQQHATTLDKPIKTLIEQVNKRLEDISGHVDKRLNVGFDKTSKIFNDVLERLAKMDAVQQRMHELNSSVSDLQMILNDKRSRGAFGEVQLTHLIRNVMPEAYVAFQYTLPNNKRVDCLLKLPEPTGNIAIDSKFPLESYQAWQKDANNPNAGPARSQFKKTLKQHIDDIADKYIIPGVTSDGAILFLPAEAVFSDIHSHFPELVSYAHKRHVWLTSPTTMMAILTTASSVLKDAATKQQLHLMQQLLGALATDFTRFQKRMDHLSRHIKQAHDDVGQIHISSKKITAQFKKIEDVPLDHMTEAENTSLDLPSILEPGELEAEVDEA